MPFDPSELCLGETEKIVTFDPKEQAEGGWRVKSAKLQYYNIVLKKSRWNLVDVNEGPLDGTKQGTLQFDDQGFVGSPDPLDFYLWYFWNNGVTETQRTVVLSIEMLEMNLSHDLLVKIQP